MGLPDPEQRYPIRLPDGSRHQGTVHLSRVIDHPGIEVGDCTYYSDFDPPEDPSDYAARLAPYLFPFSAERLVIGRFCQIAHGTRFITASANHAMDGLTTFPFTIFDPETMIGYQPDTRDTCIGNDVWLGYGSLILPGTTIGNGAIIGAGAVVRGSVPDYAIVTGNPAQVARLRFSPGEVEILTALAWWDWPLEKIAAHRSLIEGSDVAALERAAAASP